jgi:hypothetical protein
MSRFFTYISRWFSIVLLVLVFILAVHIARPGVLLIFYGWIVSMFASGLGIWVGGFGVWVLYVFWVEWRNGVR